MTIARILLRALMQVVLGMLMWILLCAVRSTQVMLAPFVAAIAANPQCAVAADSSHRYSKLILPDEALNQEQDHDH